MDGFEIRKERQLPQGRKKLVRERQEYFRLMEQGYSNAEACRNVGINRRTGKVWRNGRRAHKGLKKGAPPSATGGGPLQALRLSRPRGARPHRRHAP
ncbi:helix-turn-helix domain-containing protein [Nocardiopsis gilva]|uniref:helix-turn-helix domain-containing protein n=1 Tax=Nocardiopsis gilva TaxID=280236 RepID=UPI000525666D|nr:helix-turn-helix domain-containing protein [Nocardiopsis gilva]